MQISFLQLLGGQRFGWRAALDRLGDAQLHSLAVHPSPAHPSPGGHLAVVRYDSVDAAHFRETSGSSRTVVHGNKAAGWRHHPHAKVTPLQLTARRLGEYSEN
jgi:hypothetical protein